MKSGWIKLHRSLRDWEWYDDKNARLLLIHLLISVNYKDKKWKGTVIKAGSMVFSWETLSKNCNLKLMQCRTAMRKLEKSGEVTRYSTNKYQVVSLVKWDDLQSNDNQVNSQDNNQVTSKYQANNRQVTTTKESNNIINKEYNINSENKSFAYKFSYGKNIKYGFLDYKSDVIIPERFKDFTINKLFSNYHQDLVDGKLTKSHFYSGLVKEAQFNKFWDIYDKKVDRKESKTEFMKLSHDEINKAIASAKIYVSSTPESKYRKNPSGWLKKRRWEDNIQKEEKVSQRANKSMSGIDYDSLMGNK